MTEQIFEKTKIRKDIIAAIIGKTLAGNNVNDNEIREKIPEKLPYINVTTPSDTAKLSSETEVSYNRTMQIEIACIDKASGGLYDRLDVMSETVIKTLIEAEISDKIPGLTYIRSEMHKYNGAEQIGITVVVFEMTFKSIYTVNHDDFNQSNVSYREKETDEVLYSDTLTLNPTT